MALNTYPKTDMDGTITLSDGTGVAVTLTVPMTKGDLSITGLEEGGASGPPREDVVIQSRGTLHAVRRGAIKFPELDFSAFLPGMTSSAVGAVRDFLGFEGAYSANISTMNTAAGSPKTLDLIFAVEGTDHGDVDETVTCTNVRFTYDIAEAGDGNVISIKGTIYGTVTYATVP